MQIQQCHIKGQFCFMLPSSGLELKRTILLLICITNNVPCFNHSYYKAMVKLVPLELLFLEWTVAGSLPVITIRNVLSCHGNMLSSITITCILLSSSNTVYILLGSAQWPIVNPTWLNLSSCITLGQSESPCWTSCLTWENSKHLQNHLQSNLGNWVWTWRNALKQQKNRKDKQKKYTVRRGNEITMVRVQCSVNNMQTIWIDI